jgi:outer membrane protein TolC
LNNDDENLRRLEQTFKLIQAQTAAGMTRRVEADRAEQDVLKAKVRIQSSTQAYRNALDQFKLTLGLPIAASIEVDQGELERLKPLPIPFDQKQAIETALRTRPDVLIQRASVRDARRNVEIAADAFNPRLDLALGISAAGTQPRSPFRVMTHRHTRFARLSVDYNFDQRNNRDSYRNSMIALDKAQRDLDEFLDGVALDVRRALRGLVESQKTYEIQKAGVALSERWAALAKEEQKEGLVSTRDVLEAEDALRVSKNGMTSALVDYTTTRLSFLAKLGMISVDKQGKFHERTKPEYFDRSATPDPTGR